MFICHVWSRDGDGSVEFEATFTSPASVLRYFWSEYARQRQVIDFYDFADSEIFSSKSWRQTCDIYCLYFYKVGIVVWSCSLSRTSTRSNLWLRDYNLSINTMSNRSTTVPVGYSSTTWSLRVEEVLTIGWTCLMIPISSTMIIITGWLFNYK